ncbi:MAG: hypothetical protein L6243_01150 [Candidatus Altiarchaeales archaeon]|nr:malate dehydrogenase [Candidatus Altiarchaeota archaeon]MBU4342178.1 malate dehydrogenase [Candidatus Altiarchaeota archaeon]MBU4436877.1 malate dehydrogenase [Candidatus Altiarchaeota archaeon]MCG2782177.1 hypothetical protein [Candidatus Altiarchaeales archaeon]
MKDSSKEQALSYHSRGRPGKIEISSTKPVENQRDLSLAYTPGVAEPCKEIAREEENIFEYTSKGNMVAVITDGSAVLGLGNIGPKAALPVMEGKAVLFKKFAGVDAFPICLDTQDVEEIIKTTKLIAPGFGGINLEDISAPRCFEIEKRLKKGLDIPVFHDDQDGTAVITLAGLYNALELVGKKIDEIKVVFNGAGAAGIACAKICQVAGVKKIIMCDSKGVIYKGRKENMNPYKTEFAAETESRTLAEAMHGADVFIGVSVGGCVTQEMVESMATNPIIFAMANPTPEILPEDAHEVRDDVIMATGRSDYPNQVNNVLGFPFIFRGALDVRATEINEEMKIAAVNALASLAKEPVPDYVLEAYNLESLDFGKEYIIPKPIDKRLLEWVAGAVATAAIESGAARR